MDISARLIRVFKDYNTRELIKGSIEVYPIKDFGAIEMRLHTFHNNQEPNAPLMIGRFIVIW